MFVQRKDVYASLEQGANTIVWRIHAKEAIMVVLTQKMWRDLILYKKLLLFLLFWFYIRKALEARGVVLWCIHFLSSSLVVLNPCGFPL